MKIQIGNEVRDATPEEIAEFEARSAARDAQAPARLQAEIVQDTQKRLDDFALTRGYDNVNSISKYQNISDDEIAALPADEQTLATKFRAECRYLAVATARTWAKLYIMLAEVEAMIRPAPTCYADVEPELPALEWPA